MIYFILGVLLYVINFLEFNIDLFIKFIGVLVIFWVLIFL